MIKKHFCSSAYQDKRYGMGMRVFNKGKDKIRCTVCGDVVQISEQQIIKEEE